MKLSKENKQILGIVAGVTLGVVAGALTPTVTANDPADPALTIHGLFDTTYWIGDLWFRMLMILVVPLVLFSMISGVAFVGDIRKLGRAGAVTIAFFFSSCSIAILIGLILVNVIRPGEGVEPPTGPANAKMAENKDAGIAGIAQNLVSRNLFKSMAETEMMPIILFGLVFGAVLTTMGAKGKLVANVADAVNEALLKMVSLVMWLAPFGLFFLIAGIVAQKGGIEGIRKLWGAIFLYAITVMLALFIHGVIVLPIMLRVLSGRKILSFFKHFGPALLTAFSTASSSATMPVTLRCAEESAGISRRATRFVIPLGTTVNMDGTALYEAIAAMFIAQVYGIDSAMTLGSQLLIFVTAMLASIGAAGIPSAGLITMVIVLQAVDLPIEGALLIIPIDWFLDRFRTTVNVMGDFIGSAICERHGLSPEDLAADAAEKIDAVT